MKYMQAWNLLDYEICHENDDKSNFEVLAVQSVNTYRECSSTQQITRSERFPSKRYLFKFRTEHETWQ